MAKRLKKPDPKEVNLFAKGVSAEAREMLRVMHYSRNFNEVGNPITTGQIISENVMKAAKEELSPTAFNAYLKQYREDQARLVEAHKQISTTPDLTNE